MHFYITEEDVARQRERDMESFRRMADESAKKFSAKKAWEEAHPPCAHCGRKEPVPIWLQY